MTADGNIATEITTDRKHWMELLAGCESDLLSQAWDRLPSQPTFTWICPPEFQSLMLRARAGGDGQLFNFCEMSLTYCSISLAGGPNGIACIGRRDKRHAAIAAVLDAMLQMDTSSSLRADATGILADVRTRREILQKEKTARIRSTAVDFQISVAGAVR